MGRAASGARLWSGHGGRGYAAGVTDVAAPVPMRAVEQVCGLALVGFKAIAVGLDQ
jgi:hypothetical protein